MTNAKQANSLFIVKSSSRLLVELFSRGIAHAADSQQVLIQLAQKLFAMAEAAYTCQDINALKEASDLLITLPLPQAQHAALWYQAIINRQEGRTRKAIQRLEELAADHRAAPRFRARALQSLGRIHHACGDFDSARRLYLESARYINRAAHHDGQTFAYSIIHHSCAVSNEGDSRQALTELLSIEHLVEKLRDPLITAFYCNNAAVELLELGRLNEAAQYSRIACSSPLAFAYPEWHETAEEIKQQTAKRNTVAVAALPEPRKRPAQPKYLLIVLQFSPRVVLRKPVTLRQRVTCNNPTVALVALVARIRAPSF